MNELMCPAYQLQVVFLHEFVCDFITKEPPCAPRTHCPVGHQILGVRPYQITESTCKHNKRLVRGCWKTEYAHWWTTLSRSTFEVKWSYYVHWRWKRCVLTFVWYFLVPVNKTYVVKCSDVRWETSVNAKYLSVDESCYGQKIEHPATVLPRVGVPVPNTQKTH